MQSYNCTNFSTPHIKDQFEYNKESVWQFCFYLYNLILLLNHIKDDQTVIKFTAEDQVFCDYENLLLHKSAQKKQFLFVEVQGPIPVKSYPVHESYCQYQFQFKKPNITQKTLCLTIKPDYSLYLSCT